MGLQAGEGRVAHGPVKPHVHHHLPQSRVANLGPMQAVSTARSTATPLGGSWTSLGPQPITHGTDPVASGRVTSLAVDPTNSATVYAGAAGGGVWKTTDGGNHWAPLTDSQLELAIGALAIDASNPQVIYAATGEANHCGDCQAGQGILKSIDGGTTWVLLGQTVFAGHAIGAIVIDRANSNHLLAATTIGLYQSTDAGVTWTQSAQLTGTVQTIVQDPTTPGKFWAGVADWCKNETGSIDVSSDGGTSWLATSFPTLPHLSRVGLGVGANGVAYAALAACPTTGTPAYALGQLVAVAKTMDGGGSWTTVAPGGASGLIDYFMEPDGLEYQGWYDNAIAVDPADPNHAVFGGVTTLATKDGGSTFTDVARPYSGGPTWADFHGFVFTGADAFYAANDGGVYRTLDLGGTGSSGDWTNLSASLAISEFYTGASADLGHVVGGTQDTGTPAIWPGGPAAPAWQSKLGGDGGWVGLIPGSSLLYAETTDLSIYQVDAGTGNARLAAPCSVTSDPACNDPVGFIAPFVLDPSNNSRLFAATNRIYRSESGGLPAGSGGWQPISGDLTTGTSVDPKGDWIHTLAIGRGTAAGVLMTGSDGGRVFMTTNAAAATPTWTEITGNLPAYAASRDTGHPRITALAINPANAREAWATIGVLGSGRVWHTLSAGDPAGTTWTDITGTAGTGVVNTVVDSLLVDPASPSTVYIGTDGGAMVCTTCAGTAAAGSWVPLGTGLPNVRIDGLSMTGDGATIIAWTHGRGAWSVPRPTVPAPTPTPTPSPSPSPTPAPTPTATPTPTPTATPTPTPTATPSPTPTATPSPTATPAPVEQVSTASSTQQYAATSDGSSWIAIDGSKLSVTFTPPQDSTVVLSANADLWTTSPGVNQDIGIWVSGVDQTEYPDGIVAWKESGGTAAYSPNAAFVHAVISMTHGTTYTVTLKWKSNRAGGSIYAGAGSSSPYSPTRLTADVIPSTNAQLVSGVGTNQYSLSNNDGSSWSDMDPSRLSLTVNPTADSVAVITANADLWTGTAGYNQDLGIAVSGADPTAYPAGIIGWKESGGSAAYSPNAAAVQAVYPMKAGTSYVVKLQWKANKNAQGATIYAGAGTGTPYSPTRLTVRLLASGGGNARSTQQYTLNGNDGSTWVDMDSTSLGLSMTGKRCPAIVSGNADLWTEAAGVNQDLAITVNGSVVAWKESGGSAGTFSPNAAFVQAVIPTTNGASYTIKLQWKTNVASTAAVHAGAGPYGGLYSPSTLTVQQVC